MKKIYFLLLFLFCSYSQVYAQSNDAAVSNIYTLGTKAIPFGNPHVVKARITNAGTASISSKTVTLTVSGANSYTATQTITNLNPGASVFVYFPAYSSINTGTNQVTVSVPNDDNNSNNVITVNQIVNLNSFSYAHGTTVTGGVGFAGATGEIAVKFNSSNVNIEEVKLYFSSIGRPYRVKIWNGNGPGGTPGTLLYTSSSQTSATGLNSVPVSPIVPVSGTYYVGVAQTDTTNLSIGYQSELPLRDSTFYIGSLGGTSFSDLSALSSSYNFKIMIEPVVQCNAPAAPSTINGSSIFCPGLTTTYYVPPVTGASSYTWTLPSGWTGNSTSDTIEVTAGSTAGDITVTANNHCGISTAISLSVTATSLPATPSPISGNTFSCIGLNQSYSVPSVTGASSYTWTLPPGWTGSSTGTSISTSVGSTGGNIYVTADNICGSSPPDSLEIIVSGTPDMPVEIIGSNSLCANATATYSVQAVPGATSYNWLLPSGWTGSSTTNSITVTANSFSGSIFVSVTNPCGTSSSKSMAIAVNSSAPGQPTAINGNTSVCEHSSQTYQVPAVTGATKYNWSLPTGWSGTSSSATMNATVGSVSGQISVTAENGCGVSAAQSLNLTVIPAPAQPGIISGNTEICSGTTNVYSISPVGGASSYNWSMPSGWAGSSTSETISITAGTSSGNVSVTTFDGVCNSLPQTLLVNVKTPPAQPAAISGVTGICPGTTEIFSVDPDSNATQYIWTLPTGWTGSSNTNEITTTSGNLGGPISVYAENHCGAGTSQSLSVNILPAPAQPGPINGKTAVCGTATETYSVLSVPGATSYTWTLPPGWTGSSSTNAIMVTPTNTGGTISVTANNSDCPSLPRTLDISIDAMPAMPDPISGPDASCSGYEEVYTVNPISGNVNYKWELPIGWSGNSTSNSITVTAGPSGGAITVEVINSCGSSPKQSKTVASTPLPPIPTISQNGDELTSSAASGNQWFLDSNPIPGATSQTYVAIKSGTYSVTVTVGAGCSSSSAAIELNEVSVKIYPDGQSLKIYPNPSGNMVTISFEGAIPEENILILNLLGKTVKSISPVEFSAAKEFTFSGQELGTGVYFLSFRNEKSVVTKKFVIR